ncbi:MAG TPA: divalent-cation tolerance protein CutA [Steroidobacteraceae bacterium]|jgi:periplasmic divalent cation tolerance protein|nr:divalent-cation tolerance protein CutA [Steroidobacteraceae bacterium]
MKTIAVVTTVATAAQARAMARALVTRRLAACAQICAIESVYRWKDRVHEEPEHRIVFKTTSERYQALEAAIKELHSYELPAIHALALEQVHAPYAQWIEQNCTGDESR